MVLQELVMKWHTMKTKYDELQKKIAALYEEWEAAQS